MGFAHLSFRPPSPPQCGPSDGPTRCCTWSKSVWQALLCSRDWQACSWQCTLPQVHTGSEVRAPAGLRGRSPGAHSGSRSHHHLSLWEEEKEKVKLMTATAGNVIHRFQLNPSLFYRLTLTTNRLQSWFRENMLHSFNHSFSLCDSHQWAALSNTLPLNWVCTRHCCFHLITNNCRVTSQWPGQRTIFFHWAIKCSFNQHPIVVSICGQRQIDREGAKEEGRHEEGHNAWFPSISMI